MNRGSREHGRDGSGRTARFNEAPIHESGKFTPPRVASRRAYLLQ